VVEKKNGMKKKFGWTYLFGAVVVALIGFTVFDFQRAEKAETEKEASSRVLSLEASDVAAFEYSVKGEVRRLEKKDDRWIVVLPFQDSADQQAVQTFIESLLSERVQETVKEGEGINLSTYGLDKPLLTLDISTLSAKTSLRIGSVKAYDGSLYGQIDDQKKILLLSSAWDVYLSKPARELRDKRVYRGDPKAKALSVNLKGQVEGKRVALDFKRDEKGAWVSQTLAGQKLSEKSVDAFVEQVKALRAFDFTSIQSSNKAGLKSVGLEKPGYEISISFEGAAQPFKLGFAEEEKKEDTNIQTLSSDLPLALAVYKVAARKLMVSSKNFLDPKAPFQFDVNKVASIHIHAENLTPPVTLDFQKKGNDWTRGLQSPADSTKLNELLEKLTRLEAVRFFDQADVPAKKSIPSKISLLAADGSEIFEMSWGDTFTEKAHGDKPEAVVLPVLTNQSKEPVGIAEGSIKSLGLETL
jgi:Domain of unknown function (DUF4340)